MSRIKNVPRRAAGPDIRHIVIGNEGALCFITEVTVKLHGIPEAISGGVCPFPSVEAACNATIATIQSGIPVARIELFDELQVKACNAYSKLALPESPARRFCGDCGGRRRPMMFSWSMAAWNHFAGKRPVL